MRAWPSRAAALAVLLLAFAGALRAGPLNYQDLWWGGPEENGWGLSISQQGTTLFIVLYVYDADGAPQWVVMPEARWNPDFTAVTGPLYVPAGTPFSAYDASRLVVGAPVGSASIEFAGTSAATLRYSVNGATGTKAIMRQAFGAGAPIGNYTDLWWGGVPQNGWGLSLTQQGPVVFGVWYTYDAQGRPRWFVMSDGRFTSPDTVSGTLYRTSGSPWAGARYDAARLRVTAVGMLTVSFKDANNAAFKYVVDGVEGRVDIARQPFGNAAPPTLSSFAKLQEKVLTPACVSCHTAGHPYAVQSGLVLDPSGAYRNLVSGAVTLTDAVARGFRKLVVPGNAEASFLYRKLAMWDGTQAAGLGSPMPLGYTSLSVGQLDFIRRWIEAGAPENGEVADAALLEDATLPASAPFAPLVPPPAGKGVQLRVDPFSVQPRFERELFVYRSLGNAEPIYVSRVETRMRTNSHHLVLYGFQPDTPALAIPPLDVVRDIRNPDGSMNFLNMLPMAYHVFVAGAMSPEGGYSFPPGVALRLPAGSALDFNVHYVNNGAAPITGEAYANLHTVDASQVQQVASTLFLSNTSIVLPPMQRTTQSRTFRFPTATRVLALSSHMHKLGEKFVIRIAGGARDGEAVYESTEWEHPRMVGFSPALTLQSGEGLTSVVTYNNTTAATVTFGLTSEDEMGIIFGYTY